MNPLKAHARRLFKIALRGLIYLAFQATIRVLSACGFKVATMLGRGIGALSFRLLFRERKRAERQFSLAFPEIPARTKMRILDHSFRHLGEAAVELLYAEEILKKETITVTGLAELTQAYAQKRGVIVATGHYGNWELMAATMARRGFPITVIARRVYDIRIDRWMRSWRERWGIRTIVREEKGALVEIMRALKRGDLLGILFDLDTQVESELVPFFGIPARTPVAPVKLALRGSPLFFAAIRRTGPGSHSIHFTPVAFSTLSEGLTRLNHLLETTIREAPEQWIWFQRRFPQVPF